VVEHCGRAVICLPEHGSRVLFELGHAYSDVSEDNFQNWLHIQSYKSLRSRVLSNQPGGTVDTCATPIMALRWGFGVDDVVADVGIQQDHG
jgi:hypothetical protein